MRAAAYISYIQGIGFIIMQIQRTALILIDLQKESKYGIQNVAAAVSAARTVIAACRALDIPVIYTRQINRLDGIGLPNGAAVDHTGQPVYYRAGSKAVEIIDEIAPHTHDIIIDKPQWSGFYATALDSILRDLGTEHLIMGGFVTDGCLMTSVFDAYARGYQVNLVKDVCAATNEGAHKAAILMLANWVYDIEILSASQLIRKLEDNPYRSWQSTAPDQMQFTGNTLDSVFASLD